jgi:hypothetical protein
VGGEGGRRVIDVEVHDGFIFRTIKYRRMMFEFKVRLHLCVEAHDDDMKAREWGGGVISYGLQALDSCTFLAPGLCKDVDFL